MRRTTVKLPDELDARLRHEAARGGRTVSELTRDAIDLYLGGPVGLKLLETHLAPLFVPLLAVSEVAHLVATRLGVAARVRFLGDLAAGVLTPEPVLAGDWARIAELTGRYGDLSLVTVDASVVTTAERLKVGEVATLDRRHVGGVRSPPGHAHPASGSFRDSS